VTTLENLEMRRSARVIIIDGGQRVRAHLNNLGIHVGDWVMVVERAPFRGPILVEANGTRFALGRGVAAKVHVDYEGVLEDLSDRRREQIEQAS
jgi:ferrous iron transport protein A